MTVQQMSTMIDSSVCRDQYSGAIVVYFSAKITDIDE